MSRSFLLFSVLLTLVAARGAPAQTVTVEPYRDPNTAALKSLVVPGWGQFSNDQPDKGTFLAINAVVALLFATDIVSLASEGSAADLERVLGWVDYGLSAVAGSYDAFVHAERINRENGYLLEDAGRTSPRDDPYVTLIAWRKRF